MKKKGKAKLPKRITKSPETETESIPSPHLAETLQRIAERLVALERKMDLMLDQAAAEQPQPQNVTNESPRHEPRHRPQRSLPSQHGGQRPSHRSHGHQGPKPHLTSQGGQPPMQSHGPRALYQAVCAECNKECEVPFKPVPERPVYCKECYASRKKGKRGAKHPHAAPANDSQPQTHERHPGGGGGRAERRVVRVVPNGVGKVTISEMVPSPSETAAPASQRHPKTRRPKLAKTK